MVALYDRGEFADAGSAAAAGWMSRETFAGSGTSGGFGGAVSLMGPGVIGMGGNLLDTQILEPAIPGDLTTEPTAFRIFDGTPEGKIK